MPISRHVTEVIVPPLNGRREALGLATAIFIICLMMACRLALLNSHKKPLLLQAYQHFDHTLNDQQRSIYQSLLTAQSEINYLWEENKAWPTAEALGDEGIPPFATAMMPIGLRNYTWETRDRGPWVDYISHDTHATKEEASFLLRVIDLHAEFHPHPHPGSDYDPDQPTASQIWFHPLKNQRYPGMQLAERGWFWIMSADDSLLSIPSTIPPKLSK